MINTLEKPKSISKKSQITEKKIIINVNPISKNGIKQKEKNLSTNTSNKISMNIKDYSKLSSFKSISDSIRPVYYICALQDDRLATCSFDHSIKIYDNVKYKLQQKIKCHKSHVVYITQLFDGRLLSCSRDYTMKLIKLTSDNSYKVEQTLNNYKFQLENNLILYTNKVDSILDLKGVKELISASHKEKLVVFWKLNTYEKICSLNIQCWERPCVLYELNNNFAAIGGNGIYIIQLKNHNITNVLQSNLTEYFYMLNDKSFLTIESYYSLRHYKVDKKRVILIGEIKEAHKKCIYSICQFKNGIIATADFGGLIKLWN